MSTAEVVVKKRGRPKKIVAEVAELEVVETETKAPKKPTTTRLKSTKAAKTTTTAAKKAATTTKGTAKITSRSKKAAESAKATEPTLKPPTAVPSIGTLAKDSILAGNSIQGETASSDSLSAAAEKTTGVAAKATETSTVSTEPATQAEAAVAILEIGGGQEAATKAPESKSLISTTSPSPELRVESAPSTVTLGTSKILQKVNELPQKPFHSQLLASKSAPPTSAAKTATVPPEIKVERLATGPESAAPKVKKIPKPTMPQTPPKPKVSPTKPVTATSKTVPPGAPKGKLPNAALNPVIFSDKSAQAGARPIAGGDRPLPPNYKPVARKVTMAIVAMPILIVTSYVLYQRLALGEDRKHLVPPEMTAVESASDENVLIKRKGT